MKSKTFPLLPKLVSDIQVTWSHLPARFPALNHAMIDTVTAVFFSPLLSLYSFYFAWFLFFIFWGIIYGEFLILFLINLIVTIVEIRI